MSRGGAVKKAEAKAAAEAAKAVAEEAAKAPEGGDDGPVDPAVAEDPKVIDGAGGESLGGPPPEPAPTPAPAPTRARKAHPYQVAPGKSISCVRGVLGPGEEIAARDLVRTPKDGDKSQEQLDALVEKGLVIKAKSGAEAEE